MNFKKINVQNVLKKLFLVEEKTFVLLAKTVKTVIHRAESVRSVRQGVSHLRQIVLLVPLKHFQMVNLLVHLVLKVAVSAIVVLGTALNAVKVMD